MTTTATRIPNLPSATVVTGSDYLIVFQGGVTKKVQADALPASSAAWSAITGKPTTISGYAITDAYTKAEVDTALSGKQPTDADLTAIAALSGTTGLLKKTAANTWTLDTSAYVTSSGVTAVSGTAPIVSSGGTTPAISISAATTSAAGSMSAADKTKLDGIAAGAQVNVATNIAEGTRTTTTVPITSSTGTGATLSAATTSLAGVMTSTDKAKLDGIAAGAQVNVATNLAQGTRTTTAVPITSSTGTSATLDSATTSLAGVMSAADKTKLDGIATNANNYTHPANHPASIITQDASNRFVTDAEKTTWNAKQSALGYTAENTANKGAANGYAGLDATGKVPSAQLPSYVDDVLEYTNLAAFPATGSAGVMYVALDTNKVYRWSGSAYVYITSGAVDSVAGKTGVVTLVKGDVGLGNVDNTADSAKPVSTAQQAALNAKEGTITAGTTAQFWRGDKTWQDLFTEVRAATLTGLSTATNAVITATDTVLGALGKLQAQVTAHFGAGGTAHSNVVAGGSAGFMSGADKTKLDGIAASANNYTLPAATDTALGGIELGSATVQTTAANAITTTASRTYALQVNAAGQGVTNVPWTDTVYTHPTGDGNLHVPATGTTNNGKVLTAGATAGSLSWTTPTTGTVTSVAVSVPAFLSVSGSPVTSSGTITISYSGTALPLANGGTGATTAAAARTNLGAAESVQQAGSAFDFNNYRPSTPGLLRVVWNSGDTSMVNAPNGNTTGFLLASQGSHGLWNSQLFMEQGASGSVWSRGSSDAGGTRSWGTWRKQLDSSNYNSYAPTLTGTGASGTWGISITGNAATVTNGVYTSGIYNDPAWLTGVNYSKLTGTVPTWNQNTTGSAAILTTGRTIGMTGDVTWTSPAFNGSGNVTAAATLASSGVTAGTYNNSATAITPYTVDAKGRITATGAAVTITPAWGSVTGKPATIGGYGISDAASLVASTATGDATNTTPWAKLATFNSGTTQYAEAQYIVAVTTSISGVGAQTVLLSVYVRSHATNAVPDTYIHMLGKNGAEVHLSDDAFKVINGAWSSNHELWIRRNSGYGRFFVYLLSKNNSGFTETWHANAAWQTAVPTGANVNRTTNGVETPGKSTAKTFTSTVATGTAPLTVASTTVVPNLNADLLDGAHVGTSGATIPLLSTANTWGNNQTFSGNSSGAMVTITNAGSGVGLALDDFTVTSSTVVTNLNADYLDGVHKQDLMNRTGSSAAAYNFEAGAYFGLNAYYDTAWRARNTQNGWFAFRNGDNGTGLQLFVQDGAVTAGATVTYDAYAWRDGDFFSGSNKYWHAGNDGASSGLDADLLDGQQGSYYQNAGNLNAGTLPDACLPTRLGTVAASIADWNTAITNGYYMGAGATNSPTASIWYIGHVVAHNSLWVTQTVWGFANNSEATDTYTYRREMNNGAWTAWERVWQTQSELDARYLNASNLTSGTLPEARLPTSDRTRRITISTVTPSGGADGDIWFMYAA